MIPLLYKVPKSAEFPHGQATILLPSDDLQTGKDLDTPGAKEQFSRTSVHYGYFLDPKEAEAAIKAGPELQVGWPSKLVADVMAEEAAALEKAAAKIEREKIKVEPVKPKEKEMAIHPKPKPKPKPRPKRT